MEEVNNRSRTSAATSLALHDTGLFIIIGGSDKHLKGSSILGVVTLSRIERLEIWDIRVFREINANE